MAVVNVMEFLVDQKLGEAISTMDCCKCEKCLDDIRAMALNKLQPKYVSTDKGRLYSKLNSVMEHQSNVDLNVAVLSAIEFVNNHPRHNEEEKYPKEDKKT